MASRPYFLHRKLPDAPKPSDLTPADLAADRTYSNLLFDYMLSHGLSFCIAHYRAHGEVPSLLVLADHVEGLTLRTCAEYITSSYDHQGGRASLYATPVQVSSAAASAAALALEVERCAEIVALASKGGKAKRKSALTYDRIAHLGHLSHAEVAALVGKGRDRVRAVRRAEAKRQSELAAQRSMHDHLLTPGVCVEYADAGVCVEYAKERVRGVVYPLDKQQEHQTLTLQQLQQTQKSHVLTSEQIDELLKIDSSKRTDHVLTPDSIDEFLSSVEVHDDHSAHDREPVAKSSPAPWTSGYLSESELREMLGFLA